MIHTVSAYIDPMAGSLVLQSILAGVVGVLVVCRGYMSSLFGLVTGWTASRAKQGK